MEIVKAYFKLYFEPLPSIEGRYAVISAILQVLLVVGVISGSAFAGFTIDVPTSTVVMPDGSMTTVEAPRWPFAVGIPSVAALVLAVWAGIRQTRELLRLKSPQRKEVLIESLERAMQTLHNIRKFAALETDSEGLARQRDLFMQLDWVIKMELRSLRPAYVQRYQRDRQDNPNYDLAKVDAESDITKKLFMIEAHAFDLEMSRRMKNLTEILETHYSS